MAIADYLNALDRDKQTLVENLNAQGVAADNSETFTTLAPKVLDIATGEPAYRWKIKVADELPATANNLDIVLIPIEGAAAITATKIKTVAVYANLAPEKGNIYPDNTISLFGATEGVAGTGELYLDLGTFTMEMPVTVGDSVINVDGEQVAYTPYIYSGGQWVECAYYKLPMVKTYTEALALSSFFGKGYTITGDSLFVKLNLEDAAESTETEPTVILFNLPEFFGKGYTITGDDLFTKLGLTESASYNLGGEDIPIT